MCLNEDLSHNFAMKSTQRRTTIYYFPFVHIYLRLYNDNSSVETFFIRNKNNIFRTTILYCSETHRNREIERFNHLFTFCLCIVYAYRI